MALVRDERDRFAGLLNATAKALGLDAALVEKDYWAVEALRTISDGFDVTINEADVRIRPLFKGGTSPSMGFGLIERFSEDVDLLIPVPIDEPDGYSQNQRASVMKACTAAVSTALGIDGERGGGRKGVDLHWRYGGGSWPGSVRTIGRNLGADRAAPPTVSTDERSRKWRRSAEGTTSR